MFTQQIKNIPKIIMKNNICSLIKLIFNACCFEVKKNTLTQYIFFI